MKLNNIPNKLYNIDDKHFYHSRSVAVVCHVWVLLDGEPFILVGKRGKSGDEPYKLNIPCGYIDWNENLKEAMFREVYEETGLDLTVYHGSIQYAKYEQPWYVYSSIDENRQNISLHCGIVIDLINNELPHIDLDNIIDNEADAVYWWHYKTILTTKQDEWAFNHLEKIKMFYHEIKHLLNK